MQPQVSTDVFETVDSFTSAATASLGGILVLAGVIIGLTIAIRQKTVPGAIIGIVVGGLIAALGGIIVNVSGVFEETFTSASPAHGISQTHVPGDAEKALDSAQGTDAV